MVTPSTLARLHHRSQWLRQTALARLRVHGYRWMGSTGIHPKCLFGPNVRIDRPYLLEMEQRCVLQQGVWFLIHSDEASLHVGEYTFIGRDVEIEVSTSILIGRHCLIGPGVYITDHNHDLSARGPMFQAPCIHGPVTIEDNVWIGARAIILPGVTIESGAVVGAGAVVTRSVARDTIVVGVPARPIRSRLPASPP